jgi:hypothetical protein
MPAHSRSQNGVAELVIGPATSGRTRWLAYAGGPCSGGAMDCRIKSGNDEKANAASGRGGYYNHRLEICSLFAQFDPVAPTTNSDER